MTNFANFHFVEPAWLWLALLGPIALVLLYRHAAEKRRQELERMVAPHFAQQLTTSHSPARRQFKNGLLLVAFALAGVALARPQWGHVDTSNGWVGEDVVFVLDCSRSMLSTDARPDRLDSAKYAIMNFVQRYARGRVGLVAFAGSAFTECPLTFDYDAFNETLLAMSDKAIPDPGTDIGQGLEEAARDMDKRSRHKLVVLLTDGEDLENTGVTTAKSLGTNGVVVFTIGVGTPAGKEIQYVNDAGQTEWVRDPNGNLVRSRLDERTLREIAEATGGQYYPLGPAGSGLMDVRFAVRNLDITGGPRSPAENGVDHFHAPIALALALVVGESLISTRRKQSPEHAKAWTPNS
ncbi:MAG TPA: VWA domain-containing protein [Candidatus Sulfotelmatobacter sp.]|nr:VWA domain-containing protein [Candidatus Sulfotelmatobacter sp.]